ncbi:MULTISPECIES: TetR family transcriptional regulator [Pseudomonas]|uniref:TetR family transcriptional regulator n=1 Tax=Pseudomonas TaxID=286 RepID=UPI00068E8892|nr:MULTISPECIES: TetR family transcriptional regulator [Pseudomonas]MDQ2483295.1 TetR family transcriptional regulator [Pseudomonas putida]PMU27649.1 TetR family transcriptional regulator [Pseudomonas sp. GP01-A9]PMU32809.1 TetR family transcriptional regulator [Pseudomonas sp. GP01-A13]PMU45069.1 TetR family transcriptional regulator [Pseudomonas sp. GP01-A8]PMU56878.1 TetR family transcriptional regulator [Pseudomonas sp. GP01-A14]
MRRTKIQMERTRQRLLDAAECVFSDQGFAAAKLEAIADAAGLSRGSIYWHFKGKSELLEAVVDRAWFPWDVLPVDKTEVERLPSIAEMAGALGQGVQRTLFEPRLRRSALILLQARELRGVSERVLLRLQGMQQRIGRHVSMVVEQSAGRGDSGVQGRAVGTFIFGALSEALMLGRPGEHGLVGQEVERFVLRLLMPAVAERHSDR